MRNPVHSGEDVMKRILQIIEKALEIEKDMGEQELSLNWGLITMAEWADENPLEPIGDLIYQRSIAYDEARESRKRLDSLKHQLNDLTGAKLFNIQLLSENEKLYDKCIKYEEEIKRLKRKIKK